MKKTLAFLVLLLLLTVGTLYILNKKEPLLSPLGKLKPRPLLSYSFENLKRTKFPPTPITLGHTVSQNSEDFISQIFYFYVPVTPGSSKMKRVSGLINIPKNPGTYPVIVMFRGFVPDNQYKPGVGTQPSASIFAKNGYITLAPDFLGYGESDKGAQGFENRFQTYTTALSLLSSLQTLNTALSASYSGTLQADLSKIGIWGHSNGGHIALSALSISGLTYPTVLWAPVSTSFPYSILYYTDESDDQGKALRKDLASFEEDYDTDLFSPPLYYKWIKAPLEIHQGTADREVPVWWSDDLVAKLKKDDRDVTYFTYPGADHNLEPTGWSQAVQSSMDFFASHFQKK